MRYAPLMFLFAVSVMLAPRPAMAVLLTLGDITKAGLWDENPLHMALLMEGEWRPDLISEDGGITWKNSADKLPPEKLRPLPQDGQVQYRFAQTPELAETTVLSGQRLIGSKDGGLTWIDISPWEFLREQRTAEIEKRKAEYLAQYGHWLPAKDDHWPIVFSVAAGLLLFAGGWILWRQKQAILLPLLSSGACGLIGWISLTFVHAFFTKFFTDDQWADMFWHSNPVQFPRWPTGLVLHLAGNIWLAPLAAIVCLSASPLFFALM